MGLEKEALEQSKMFIDENMESAQLYTLGSGQAVVYSKRSPEKTETNEDAAGLFPINDDTVVLAVADGVGGARSGEKAANLALKAMHEALKEGAKEGHDSRVAILNGFERANKAVLDLGVGAATTLAVVEISNDSARPYHVGDSLILGIGQRGKVKMQVVSHSPVGYALESGLLNEQEAMNHEDRHIVSNLVGSTDMRIEIGSTVELSPLDTVIVASDGLSDNLSHEEIIERARKGTLEEVAESLASDCQQRMNANGSKSPSKPDDLTFIAFRLKDD